MKIVLETVKKLEMPMSVKDLGILTNWRLN